MRPVLLTLEGFRSFADKSVVDFRDLSLFAITGMTGSGKSSLLEAMTFALFGESLKQDTHSDIVNLRKSEASIEFEFQIQNKHYKVVRTIPRKGSKKANLYERKDEKFEQILSGTDNLNDHLKELLGLDLKTFTQTVILPQGKYSQFLDAKPDERRKLLHELLGTKIYEQMSAVCGEHHKATESSLESNRQLVRELQGSISEEILVGKQKEQQNCSLFLHEVGALLQAATERAQEAQKQYEAYHSLLLIREEKRALCTQDASIQQKHAALSRSASCEHLLIKLQQQEFCQKQQEQSQLRLGSKKEEARARERELEELVQQQETSTQALSQHPRFEKEQQQLAQGIQELQLYQTHRDALLQKQREKEAQEAALQRHETEYQSARSKEDEVLALLAQHKQELRRQQVEPALVETLREAIREEQDYETELSTLSALSTRREVAETELQNAEAAFSKELLARKETSAALQRAKQRLQQASDALRQAEQANMALALRSCLQPGDSCPVCTAEVAELPVESAPQVEVAKEALAAAEKEALTRETAEKKAEKALQDAETSVFTRRQQLVGILTLLQEKQEQCTEREKKRVVLQVALAALLTNDLAQVEDQEREQRSTQTLWNHPAATGSRRAAQESYVATLLARQKNASKSKEAIDREELAAERAKSQSSNLLEKKLTAKQNILQLEVQCREKELPCKHSEALLLSLGYSIENVQKTMSRLLQELSTRKEKLTAQLAQEQLEAKVLERKLQLARETLEKLTLELVVLQQECDNDAAALLAAEQELQPELDKLQLSSTAIRQVILPPEQAARLKEEIQLYQLQLQKLEIREADAAALAGDVAITQEEVQQRKQECEALQLRKEEAHRKLGQLQGEITRGHSDLQRLREAEQREDTLEQQNRLLRELKEDLKSSNFQAYVLEEVLQLIARASSELLFRFSEQRYTLISKLATATEYRFFVVDHWEAGKERPVTSLSGGEIFMTSLAMAVSMAENIFQLATKQNASNMLESLFLDEGFGTLDEESLQRVVRVLEDLQSRSNRMIGVISHIRELTEQLPDSIEVDKQVVGSRVLRRKN